jgi:AbiV family abortive infection protein
MGLDRVGISCSVLLLDKKALKSPSSIFIQTEEVRSKMSRIQIYTKAIVESIRNSGMWLNEAKIMAKKGSRGHAQALLIFAGEELGKAAHCWFVRIGIFPMNHPDVDYVKKDHEGIFRSHSLKSATAMGLIMGAEYPEAIPDDEPNSTMVDPFTNAPSNVRKVLAKMGAFAAWARVRWMYVDIVDENGEYEVISPLDRNPKEIDAATEGMGRTLNAFKKLVRLDPLPEDMIEWIDSTLEFLKKNDERFPKNPVWA